MNALVKTSTRVHTTSDSVPLLHEHKFLTASLKPISVVIALSDLQTKRK